jgi:hypothetical protein
MLLSHHLTSSFCQCPLLLGDGYVHDVICVITPCSIKFVPTFRRHFVEMDAKLSIILRIEAARYSETPGNT